jgi:predicted 3-demethylubiquinone-9 3-methyltransferase (glyoxalase superfamily)
MTHSIRTVLWFRDGRGREAADFYCSLIPDSRVGRTFSGDAGQGTFSVIDFTLAGVPYQILDAGPHFTLTEAVSVAVETADQAETDRLWAALTEGGKEGPCGWLTDRYGLSWQIYPKRLSELTLSRDKAVSDAAMAAMMKQKKIDIAAIEAAVRDVS